MKIAVFGATYAGGYAFPTYRASDDMTTERPSIVTRVGGASGAYDFIGTAANPIAPVIVRKNFNITASTYAGVETALETARSSLLAAAENKLWALMRDGTHRWTWGKVTAFSAPENVGTRLTIPVSVEFMCRDGVWYGETANTSTKTTTGAHSFANAGNHDAALKVTVTPAATPVTAFSLTATGQGWSWAGSVAAGNALVVDSAAYLCTNNGADDYAGLTPTDPAYLWLYLPSGNTSITLAKTQVGGTYSAVFEWYDTWVM